MNAAGQPGHVRLELRFWSGAPGRIRTRDPLLRRQLLYPTELPALCDPLCRAKVTSRLRAGPSVAGEYH